MLKSCKHLKEHGGAKAAVRDLQIQSLQYVARFDIKNYYQSIDHGILIAQLSHFKVPQIYITLVKDYLTLPDWQRSGLGMVAGGAIAPLLGAVYLHPLDTLMQDLKAHGRVVDYVRYMDDILIVCEKAGHLRRAIASMHDLLDDLGLKVHRDKKRFIGRACRGFDFLGYRICPGRKLRPSAETYRRLQIKARVLKEKGCLYDFFRYLKHWWRWIFAGLGNRVSYPGGFARLRKRIEHNLRSQEYPTRTS